METRALITEKFTRVAQEQGRSIPDLSDDTPLIETGLDSLCFAIIVARLEDALGVDPFVAEDTLFPTTFGDFVVLYENAARRTG